jgi:hypothetical protein
MQTKLDIQQVRNKQLNFNEQKLIPAWFGNNALSLALGKLGKKKYEGKKHEGKKQYQ